MPFLGQDWRGPGCNWSKVESSRWEVKEQNLGVMLDTIPKNHVKKIIETFLRQMQQKKNRSMYTNLTSAPVSKCSVREEINWLQIGHKGSKEIHGYTTLGEMIRRLDLAGAARISYRFPYILEIAELLVRKKMSTLSGTAQTHLFHLIDALLQQVLATKREIRRMHFLLNRLMTILQHQSKKSLFSSKVSWFDNIALVRKWQTELKLIAIPRRVDNRVTLSDLPVELQRQIVSSLNDADDIRSISHVNRSLHLLSEETSTWRNLCQRNFSEEQMEQAKAMMLKKMLRRRKEDERAGKSPHIVPKYDFHKPTTTEEWKVLYFWMKKTYEAKETEFVDPLLFCKRCSILFWEVTGHPCINEVTNMKPEVERLTPRKVIFFFE